MIGNLFNTFVNVKRRTDISIASRDSLNNPIFGAPTASWNTIYTNMPVHLAFSAKPIKFADTAERILPNGVVYVPVNFTIQAEDRFITTDTAIEYVVLSVVPGYLFGAVIDHWEIRVDLP